MVVLPRPFGTSVPPSSQPSKRLSLHCPTTRSLATQNSLRPSPGLAFPPLLRQGEGTQIEAARAPDGGEAGGGTARYQSYGGTTGHDEWLYMRLTAGFAARLGAQQRQRGGAQQHGGGAHSEL